MPAWTYVIVARYVNRTGETMSFCCGKSGIVALATVLLFLALIGPVTAHPRHYGYSGHGGVTAQSRYGNGSATGRVRVGPRGYPEVQLPSGRWEDCEGNCANALREKHLDFWETIDENAPNIR